ncbi:MAG: DNA polymerase III subunit chi [Sphingorhabdus sp.]
MQVDFYQLTRDPADKLLPAIAQRVMDQGERLLIVSAELAQLSLISSSLWNWKPDSFLAHAMVGHGNAEQPILLSDTAEPVNGARFVAIADGQWRDSALTFERIFYLFTPHQANSAREAWRALGGDGAVDRRYWKQEGSKWVQGP